MTFNIIKRRKNILDSISNTTWAALISFFFIFLIMIIYSHLPSSFANNFLPIFMLILFLPVIVVVMIKYSDYQKLNSDIVGRLELERNFIKIGNQIFYLENIKSTDFKIRNYKGMRNGSRYEAEFSIGKGNYYQFITKENIEYKGEFLIQNESDFINLSDLYNKIRIKVKFDIDCY